MRKRWKLPSRAYAKLLLSERRHRILDPFQIGGVTLTGGLFEGLAPHLARSYSILIREPGQPPMPDAPGGPGQS